MFLHCFVNRYVDNICKNPTEEKYRKIKLSNKVFQVGLYIHDRFHGIPSKSKQFLSYHSLI